MSNFVTPWTAAHQACLSFTISWNLFKLRSFELVIPSNHLILYCPLLVLPSIFPSIVRGHFSFQVLLLYAYIHFNSMYILNYTGITFTVLNSQYSCRFFWLFTISSDFYSLLQFLFSSVINFFFQMSELNIQMSTNKKRKVELRT